MKLWNSNTLHNVINIGIVLTSGFVLIDWTAFFSESTALKIVAGLSVIKLLMNAYRDGFTGMVKEQPPVEE